MRQHMFRKTLTRAGFEKLLGGSFEPLKDNPNKRVSGNGSWSTWTGSSRLVQGQSAKFAQKSGGRAREGRRWIDLAKQLRIVD